MPVFRISYVTESSTVAFDAETYTDWVTPAGWSLDRAAESFQRQFPRSRVVSCKQLGIADSGSDCTQTQETKRDCALPPT
jgi:hypothetical protein